MGCLWQPPILTSVAMTNKKQNPVRAEGSVASATARNNERSKEGGMEGKKGWNERKKKTDNDKLKGRRDMNNRKIQGACYYSHESYACCQTELVFENLHLFTRILFHLNKYCSSSELYSV